MLFNALYFVNLPVGQVKPKNNLLEAILGCIGHALISNPDLATSFFVLVGWGALVYDRFAQFKRKFVWLWSFLTSFRIGFDFTIKHIHFNFKFNAFCLLCVEVFFLMVVYYFKIDDSLWAKNI